MAKQISYWFTGGLLEAYKVLVHIGETWTEFYIKYIYHETHKVNLIFFLSDIIISRTQCV